MDFTPQAQAELIKMPAKMAAAFIRYFRTIEGYGGNHPQSWSTCVPYVFATEFDGRGIRYRITEGKLKVMSIF